MKLIEYADAELMALDLAQMLAGELENVLFHEDRALFVVPGGTTPGPVFDFLCAADLDWSRVDVALTDERWVPESDPRSNGRLVRERLLVSRAAAARFHPLYVAAERPEDVLAEIESGIVPLLPISVLLLGMGADMHVASLFPDGDNLAAALAPNAPVLVPMRMTNVPEPRVSFSARVLNESLTRHLVITGSAKREALEKARQMEPGKAPVAAILSGCTVHWSP